MHQQTACQGNGLHDCVQKHPQNQLLTRPKSSPIDESGGNEKAAVPGLSYVSRNHNLSNSGGRSLEHLRGERTKTKPPLQLLEKKTDTVTSQRSAKRKKRGELTCV